MRLPRRIDRAMSPSSLAIASIYLLLTSVAATQSQICSTENTGTDGPYSDNFQSHGLCINSCNGYAFAILQYKNCWCSNYAPSSSGATCSTKCPGYPDDDCGSDNGAYSYVTLGPAPQGTGIGGGGGGGSSSSAGSSSSPVETPSEAPPAIPFIAIPEITQSPEHPSVVTAKPITSIQIITVSGEAQTQVITKTPSPTPVPVAPVPAVQTPTASKHGLSSGAVAGITIGVLAVVGLVAGLGIFCWRRRRRGATDAEGNSIRRNPSVLSKVGLLRTESSQGDHIPWPAAAASKLPTLRTQGLGQGSGPTSATTGESQMSENRRTSKPLFVDNRLNPNALMEHANASRTSVGTLQDDKDYTRPLEVRNPD